MISSVDAINPNVIYKEQKQKPERLDKPEESKQKLKEVCQEFEAIFVNMLLSEMRKTVPKSGLLEQGLSYDIFLAMHDEALSKEISQNGGLGLADQMYNQLSKYVE